jgi:uncharacterized membrane protein YsdA (DUF1294 family)
VIEMTEYILIYLAIISLITAVITVYDKRAAKKHPKNRIPEKVLILLALAGGSVAELLTMLKIRHKTKHKKFMIGLPVIITLQVILILINRNIMTFFKLLVKENL